MRKVTNETLVGCVGVRVDGYRRCERAEGPLKEFYMRKLRRTNKVLERSNNSSNI